MASTARAARHRHAARRQPGGVARIRTAVARHRGRHQAGRATAVGCVGAGPHQGRGRPPAAAAEQLRQLILAADAASTQSVVSLHSGESLQNLLAVLAQLTPLEAQKVQAWMNESVVLVPSARIVAAAQVAGFQKIICAENATDSAMTAALLDYCRTQECI